MDQILYVLAITGCSDDGAACQQARLEPARYTSIDACQQAMPVALERNSDLLFPVISATCQRQGARSAEAEKPRAPQGS